MTWVEEATHLGAYRLQLRFSDGVTGEVDLEPLVTGDGRALIAALANPEQFARFRVDMDTVTWENGVALSPEYLRAMLKGDSAA